MKKIILVAALAAGLAAGAETRVGIIGCDTSHAIAFTKLMNADKDPDCAGFRVTAAHKWGSPDIFSSTNRYPKYIAQLEEMGVVMKPTIADLLKDVDVVLLETCDGRPHYAQALEVFKSGKPVFIDKPVAASLADAIKIAEAGKKLNAKWFCSSALRYVKNAQAARNGKFGPIRGADCWTPNQFEATQSEFYWYARGRGRGHVGGRTSRRDARDELQEERRRARRHDLPVRQARGHGHVRGLQAAARRDPEVLQDGRSARLGGRDD